MNFGEHKVTAEIIDKLKKAIEELTKQLAKVRK